MNKPLKEQCLTLADDPYPYPAMLVLEPDELGERPIVYAGHHEVAERIMSCWNAQLGVETKHIRHAVNGRGYGRVSS